jgi:glycerophosphoryl diester phosphodiesterase
VRVAERPRTGFRFLDEPTERGEVLAFAHRGGALQPAVIGLENTLAAFRAAVDLGFRYLETDVHATRDGELLAFHDTHLDRVTELLGRVADRSYADIASARVGGREPIPRLVDLLEALPHARFNVDLKSGAAVEPLVALIGRTAAHDRLLVGSFTEPVLRAFRARMRATGGPPVATSCGVVTVTVAKFLPAGRHLQRLLRDPGVAYQVPVRHRGVRVVDRAFVERSHASGRQVHVWTVDDPAEMEHLLDLGVDGLITDRPDLLRDVLQARGLWEGTP